MGRKYTHVQELAGIIIARKARGETNREIGESLGLTKYQIKQLVAREHRRERKIAAGYVPLPKGRPRKGAATEAQKKDNEIVMLRMQVDLLRNFLQEVGRR